MAWKESFETINQCKTRIMRGGKGATLLFLHGGGGAGVWLPFLDKLSRALRRDRAGASRLRPLRYAGLARQHR